MRGFVVVPYSVFEGDFEDSPLGGREALIWLCLAADDSGTCRVDERLFLRNFRWRWGRAKQWLRDLSECGYIDVTMERGKRAAVQINRFIAIGGRPIDHTPATTNLLGKAQEARDAIPAAMRSRVMERDGARCTYCGTTEGAMHLDHVVPYARGGKTTDENLVVACAPCNLSKGARTPEEWAQ